jgi:hypothetical protein
MVHSPCEKNPKAVCKVKGVCKRFFPKDYCEKTKIIENQYPQYKRSQKQEINQYVVPYNKYLLKRYNSHINVEICTSIQAVKYLFKYIYKGYDCAQVTTKEEC